MLLMIQRPKLIGLFCGSILLLAAAGFVLPTYSTGSQSNERVMEIDSPIPNEPVKIIEAKAANKKIKFGEKFEGDKDWLKSATVKLKNVSGKEIVFIDMRVNFPETLASGNEMSFRENIGVMPGLDIPNPNGPLSLHPDGELEFVIDEKRYKNLVKFIERRHPIDSIKKAHLLVGFVAFADGTAWQAGVFYRKDPNNKKVWIPIDNPDTQ